MAITEDDVHHVAALARLGLEPGRIPQLARELDAIVAHLAVLQGAVSNDVEPMSGAGAGSGTLRPDRADADPLAALPTAGAPEARDGFFLVPRLAAHEDGDR